MSERKSDPGRDDSERAFFGRRKGHKLRQHQAELIGHLLPRLALAIDSEAPADAREIFTPAADDVRLEIGFGGGEHLAAEAQNFVTTGFIGCEPYVNGMAKILAQIEAASIGNIRLFAGDAAELLAWLPKASLSRIDLIHPDPLAETAALEAALRPGPDHRGDGARAESRRRIPFCLRHRRLLRLDAVASGALAGLCLARGARR
ncbi:hypothetical protein ACVW0I_008509 [Bradyrhizobium sp. LM6.11]